MLVGELLLFDDVKPGLVVASEPYRLNRNTDGLKVWLSSGEVLHLYGILERMESGLVVRRHWQDAPPRYSRWKRLV